MEYVRSITPSLLSGLKSRRLQVLGCLASIACLTAFWAQPDLLMLSVAALGILLSIRMVSLDSKAQHVLRTRSHVTQEKQLLVESINCAPLAFAVYGRDDRLIVWNESYELLYPKAFARFRQFSNLQNPLYADLIVESVPDSVPADEVANFVERRVNDHRKADATPIDRFYPNIGWLRVTKFVTANGAVAGFAVDISALKQQEADLRAEIARRHEMEESLKVLATTDSLTGAQNRRAFMEAVTDELGRYKRYKTSMALILLDIDWFKSVNDRFGHQVGDEVIIAVVNVVKAQTRHGIDRVGRIGGEEFGILLPQTDAQNAIVCANSIRRRIAELSFVCSDQIKVSVTASFGVSSANEDNGNLASIIGQADRAMYVSKANGRNRVTNFSNDFQSARELPSYD